jgi:hypothetical protein
MSLQLLLILTGAHFIFFLIFIDSGFRSALDLFYVLLQ